MITVKVSELLRMAKEMANDGIQYVDIEFLEADEELPQSLSFQGHDPDGLSLRDYEEIEHVDLVNNK